MNRLHILLTAAAAACAWQGGAGAVPIGPSLPALDSGLIHRVQLGNGGPVGGGPNGQSNGAHTTGSAPSVLSPSGANGGAQPAGAGSTTSPTGGQSGKLGVGLRPNSGAERGNGSKAAPMQANGVRKVD